jgi:hypothetical protein
MPKDPPRWKASPCPVDPNHPRHGRKVKAGCVYSEKFRNQSLAKWILGNVLIAIWLAILA